MDAVGTISLGAAAVAVVVAVVLLVLLLRREHRLRRRDGVLEAELAAARAESAELRERLARLERTASAEPTLRSAEFLITDAGQGSSSGREGVPVPDGLVLSATLGEPVVRVLALAHGVRRALSAESRNRIRFAMRQEVRRTRRRRKREMRHAWRQAQADERRARTGEPASGDAA
ncbi:MAG TPA: hypothetical protein VFM09_09145 [Marmoricola sp.]|nr:hypothetical protein [Marmoricola sp.]